MKCRGSKKLSLALRLIALTAIGLMSVQHRVAAQTISVSGMSNYCSITWPKTGGWALDYSSPDPCAALIQKFGSAGTIRRKGLRSTNGLNNVVATCDGYVWVYTGNGGTPFQWAFNKASGHANCVFTGAPKEMPILSAPLSLNIAYTTGNGFDHWNPGDTSRVNVSEYGQPASYAKVVDWKGRNKDTFNGGGSDGHQGYDWGVVNVPTSQRILYAVAAGTVLRVDTWPAGTRCVGQRDVYIEHVVVGTHGYSEKFVSVYAHLDSYSVVAGQVVTEGTPIGIAGNSGPCTSGPHLHFMVCRKTNTADQLEETIVFDTTKLIIHNLDQMRIDPYGWDAQTGFDPWAWRAPAGQGALSIYLWKPGQAPKQDPNW